MSEPVDSESLTAEFDAAVSHARTTRRGASHRYGLPSPTARRDRLIGTWLAFIKAAPRAAAEPFARVLEIASEHALPPLRRAAATGAFEPDSGTFVRCAAWGCVWPGWPEQAARAAWADAWQAFAEEDWIAAGFSAALIAAALVSEDAVDAVQIAAGELPAGSRTGHLASSICEALRAGASEASARADVKQMLDDVPAEHVLWTVADCLVPLLYAGRSVEALWRSHGRQRTHGAGVAAACIGALVGRSNLPDGWQATEGNLDETDLHVRTETALQAIDERHGPAAATDGR